MRILVEDELSLVRLYRESSAALKYDLVIFDASDKAIAAIDKIAAEGGVVDVAILDFDIDRRTGDDLALYLKGKFPSVVCIMNSSMPPKRFRRELWSYILRQKIATRGDLRAAWILGDSLSSSG